MRSLPEPLSAWELEPLHRRHEAHEQVILARTADARTTLAVDVRGAREAFALAGLAAALVLGARRTLTAALCPTVTAWRRDGGIADLVSLAADLSEVTTGRRALVSVSAARCIAERTGQARVSILAALRSTATVGATDVRRRTTIRFALGRATRARTHALAGVRIGLGGANLVWTTGRVGAARVIRREARSARARPCRCGSDAHRGGPAVRLATTGLTRGRASPRTDGQSTRPCRRRLVGAA